MIYINLIRIISKYKNTSENFKTLRISLKRRNLVTIMFIYIVCKISKLGYYRNNKEIDIYFISKNKFCDYCGEPIDNSKPPLIIEQHYNYSNCGHPELDRTDVLPIYNLCEDCKKVIRKDIWNAMTSCLERSEKT